MKLAILNKEVKTKHPYIITTRKEAFHEVAIIKGTGVHVWAIVGYHKLGMDPEEIVNALPHLGLSQVYDALSYYYDHKEEIDKILAENNPSEEELKRREKKFKMFL